MPPTKKFKQHEKFSSRASAKLVFDGRRKALRKVVERTPDVELLRACWVLDWGREPSFEIPKEYAFPHEYVRADMTHPKRIHSWELETLLLEAFAQKKKLVSRRTGNPRLWGYFEYVIAVLRAAENAESGLLPPGEILGEVHRIMNRQFPWQANHVHSAAVIRWHAMMNDGPLRKVYADRVGISATKVIALGLAHTELFKRNFSARKSAPLPQLDISEADIDAFFGLVAKPIDQIRRRAGELSVGSSLAYRESPLRRSPLIKISDTFYCCPLQQLLFWRVTDGLYHDVISEPTTRNFLGEGFEKFEQRLLEAAYPQAAVHKEVRYGPKGRLRSTPDIVLSEGGVLRVAFECKAKRLPIALRTSLVLDREALAIRELGKGVFQLARFRMDLRDRRYDAVQEGACSSYVVLTLDDYQFTGEALRKPVLEHAESLLAQSGVKPDFDLSDILFCTAGELDVLLCRHSLSQLLAVMAKALDPAYRHYSLVSISNDQFSDPDNVRKYPLQNEISQVFPG